MIVVQNLSKRFVPNLPDVIKKLNFSIQDGEFVALVGRSGSGKSTLLYLLSTLDRKFEGEVLYDGQDVRSMKEEDIHKLRNLQIGFVFQFHYLLNELTALDNILLPARKAGQINERLPFALELLQKVGLADKANRLPPQLSGGEQQRVAIARALVMRPKYLFADEPTGNLDSFNGDGIMKIFKQFNQEYGTSIIYVTHDQEFASRASRRIELVDGKIVFDGPQQ
jgi:ABC-type lipoprotein export system ATPase subunit